ncbi:hypothetical protein D3C80_1333400 [compost metagenome]
MQIILTHVIDETAQQEAVIQCPELFLTGRQFIGGRNQATQRHCLHHSAIVIDAFVKDCQQGIEDGGAGLEYLVEKCHPYRWQITRRIALETIFLQLADGEWPEDLLRC